MKPISYARHRFPPDVIRHAVWLYLRFTLSYRDVEDLLAERGLIVSNESIRRWVLKFGPVIAKNLRTSRPRAYTRWHRGITYKLQERLLGGLSNTILRKLEGLNLESEASGA